jgi:YggT family protein
VIGFAQAFAGIFVALLWALVFARIILSWIDPSARWRITTAIAALVEPLLAPVRRFVPPAGGFDFASVVVLVLLGMLWRVLL